MKKICISKGWKFSSPEIQGEIDVDIPHDYSIKLPRDPNAAGGASNGFFTGSQGIYKKYLSLGDEDHFILDIDGAYMCTRIYLNEDLLDMHPYGYTPYLVDLSSKVRRGRTNRITLSTQNLQPSTRWYSGAGVYRDVFLWSGGKIRIEPWDMFVKTKSISDKKALISAETTITSDTDADIELVITVKDDCGNTAAEFKNSMGVKSGKNKIEIPMEIPNAKLWDTNTPCLYTIEADILWDGKVEDSFSTTFGIRTIEFSVDKGFLLNGEPTKLRGGCIHHDHGGLGSADFPAASYRKVKLLKETGFNSLRISHNPPSLAMLEACDKLGMLVMDEAFDMWNMPKSDLDYSLWFKDWWDRDISYMVLRDRNHPCVISYSIGNEIPERNGMSDGAIWAKKLSDEIRKYDTTRPVTSGICRMWRPCDPDAPQDYKEDYLQGYKDVGNGDLDSSWDERTKDFMEPLDIVGYNYLYHRYEYDSKKYPDRIIWGSETHALDFYHSWKEVLKHNNVIGDFTWTAIDNLGEAGTGRALWARDGFVPGISLAEYPWRTCFQGDLDLCGYRRPQSYFREAIWIGNTEPRIFTIHPEHHGEEFSGTGWHWYDVLDSWTFDDKYIGMPITTTVYTDADEIHFILNDKKVGIAASNCGIASLDIPYEKGTLTAVAYKNGKKQKSYSLKTVGESDKIIVHAENDTLIADNRDLCYFNIIVTDKDGNRVPHAEDEIECTVYGGELMSVFSGNPANEDDYSSNKCHVFGGRALAIIRTKTPGIVNICVKSKNLKCGWATVTAL
jgi:beta-galactosidase